jgi:hypothetical protein
VTQRTLADKLGVKPGMRVTLVDVDDEAVLEAVNASARARGAEARSPADLVVMQVATPDGLPRIAGLRSEITRTGALWVLWSRGSAVGGSAVRAAGLDAGLVDVKVARVSDRLSGLKFVYRLRDR